jgi:hypothetical protein
MFQVLEYHNMIQYIPYFKKSCQYKVSSEVKLTKILCDKIRRFININGSNSYTIRINDIDNFNNIVKNSKRPEMKYLNDLRQIEMDDLELFFRYFFKNEKIKILRELNHDNVKYTKNHYGMYILNNFNTTKYLNAGQLVNYQTNMINEIVNDDNAETSGSPFYFVLLEEI